MRTITSWLRGPTALVLLLALAAPALADLGPDVRMQLNAPDGVLPTPGQAFTFNLEITSATTITASAPYLRTGRTPAGELAWETISFPLPTGFTLPAMQPVTFAVQLLCNDPAQPIEISLQVGGRTHDAALLPPAAGPELGHGGVRDHHARRQRHGPGRGAQRRVRPPRPGAHHAQERARHSATRVRRIPPPAATSASTAASCTTATRTTTTVTTRATAAPWAPTASR